MIVNNYEKYDYKGESNNVVKNLPKLKTRTEYMLVGSDFSQQ